MNLKELEALLTEQTPEDTKAKELVEIIKKWIKPNSKAIARYGFNHEKEILAVSYITEPNTTYFYEGIKYFIFEQLMHSKSKGKFLNELFANNHYKFTKV